VAHTAEERSHKPYILHLQEGLVVELGCGIGVNSNFGDRYLGIDLSEKAISNLNNGSGICADLADDLPLADSIADAIFSIATLEHIPEPNRVLAECARIVKAEGIIIHDDAWFCRRWTASGITVKSWNDCSLKEKLIKLSIPIRNARWFRIPTILPKRLFREWRVKTQREKFWIDYGKLEPNLEEFLVSDSDAFTSIDPHAVALFYKSRGFKLLHPKDSLFARLRYSGYIVCRKPKALGVHRC
jgi:SAM-dependent methyltransferase